MMGSDEGMMRNTGNKMMMEDRMGKIRAEDGDTVEPLKRVVQPEVKKPIYDVTICSCTF